MCNIAPPSPRRCFVKAKTLPEAIEAELTPARGKARRIRLTVPVAADKDAAGGSAEKGEADGLAEALNGLSVPVRQAQQGDRSVVDT